MPRLILLVARVLHQHLAAAPWCARSSPAVDEDLRLADIPAHREGDDAGNEPDHEHAAPADRRQQQRRDQRGAQHAGLPAERDVGAGPRPLPGRPGLRHQRHADAELAAEAEPRDGAVDQQVPVALRQRAQPGEHREQQDRPGQHPDAAVIVAEHAEQDAAGDGADQRPGHQRAGLRRGQVQVRRDGAQHEAEDQQIEAVHGVADGGCDQGLARK